MKKIESFLYLIADNIDNFILNTVSEEDIEYNFFPTINSKVILSQAYENVVKIKYENNKNSIVCSIPVEDIKNFLIDHTDKIMDLNNKDINHSDYIKYKEIFLNALKVENKNLTYERSQDLKHVNMILEEGQITHVLSFKSEPPKNILGFVQIEGRILLPRNDKWCATSISLLIPNCDIDSYPMLKKFGLESIKTIESDDFLSLIKASNGDKNMTSIILANELSHALPQQPSKKVGRKV